ncbi:MAG: hypothetical protein ABFR50_11190, partial [Candidatus Fermentibacteria bacterium]
MARIFTALVISGNLLLMPVLGLLSAGILLVAGNLLWSSYRYGGSQEAERRFVRSFHTSRSKRAELH